MSAMDDARLGAITAAMRPCSCGGRAWSQCSTCGRRVCRSYACPEPSDPCCDGAVWRAIPDVREDVPALIAEVRRLRAALDAIGAAAATYDAASNVFRAQVCGGGRIDAVSIEAAHTALLDAIRARGAGGGA